MDIATYLALIIICALLIVLIVLQSRTPGMANRDSSSVYRTRRGVEKTMHQATIALAVAFLLLSLISSLPIFS